MKVKDIRELRGVKHLRVHGKGGKLRNVPLHPATAELINDYLELARHGGDAEGGLFRSIREWTRNGRVREGLSAEGLYLMVRTWAKAVGISAERIAPHCQCRSKSRPPLTDIAGVKVDHPLFGLFSDQGRRAKPVAPDRLSG